MLIFLPKKVEKNHPKKLHIYGSWDGVFFLCSPDCLKQPRTSFPFYNFFIQSSLGKTTEDEKARAKYVFIFIYAYYSICSKQEVALFMFAHCQEHKLHCTTLTIKPYSRFFFSYLYVGILFFTVVLRCE